MTTIDKKDQFCYHRVFKIIKETDKAICVLTENENPQKNAVEAWFPKSVARLCKVATKLGGTDLGEKDAIYAPEWVRKNKPISFMFNVYAEV